MRKQHNAAIKATSF